ncbi:hypothetical protein CIL05_13400 [Virgibacillus profundi]|uniref:DUF4352 domain-containing protein n=1 Tax=Virgibacillus profundi TaxID=2024555 RepID=A0A2A2IAE8_9BACI|nr:DUF4352 domain-containing protein [Virgibacillus profundi]PAV28971.1 hypothetical protein CIL05_13400 [Virgibacillus profundi]PXY53139.1 DUF4352 domain-containing protein [Virgibacillus profundi]
MKKLLLILLAAIFVAGCSDNGEDTNSEPSENEGTSETETEDENTETENEKKAIYQIGETADITSDVYGFPYQVTVNSFELTTESVDGLSLEDLNYSAEEGARFAVANVTIKNTGDSSFVPQDKISAQLFLENEYDLPSEDDTFKERYEELAPGDEITGNLVYTDSYFYENEVVYLTYEAEAIDDETKFELPIQEE